MYEIKAGLRVISHMAPQYVRKFPNGFFLPCSEEQAEAIIVDGELYAIDPDIPVPGYPDAELAIIDTIPDGSYTDELLEAKREHTGQITDLEMGTTELADVVESTAADTIDGLCELADTVEITTTELQDGLCEQADVMAEILSDLTARIEALEMQKGA